MTASPVETVATVERILSEAFGGMVRIETEDGLGGSDRSNVFRCNVLEGPSDTPKSVVVKQALAHGDEVYDPDSTEGTAYRLFNDWAGLQFLSDIPVAPRFYGGHREKGLIVIEDLGNGESLDRVLLGGDPVAAEEGLIELAEVLGQMHALTVGKRAEYHQLRDELSPRPKNTATTEGLLTRIAHVCDATGITPHQEIRTDMQTISAFISHPGPFDAYTHGDPCPDNNLFIDGKRRLLDFEFGRFRHALIDGVYGRIHFPTCWCVNRIPEHVVRKMEDAYRAELVQGCSEAEDDELFYQAVVEACAYWVTEIFRSLTDGLLAKDNEWGISTVRQRALLRLDILAQTTEEFGHLEAIGATARDMVEKLCEFWPDVEEMPYYPAFR